MRKKTKRRSIAAAPAEPMLSPPPRVDSGARGRPTTINFRPSTIACLWLHAEAVQMKISRITDMAVAEYLLRRGMEVDTPWLDPEVVEIIRARSAPAPTLPVAKKKTAQLTASKSVPRLVAARSKQ